MVFKEVVAQIRPLDEKAMAAASERLDNLTKPVGSLGRLEELVIQLAGITGETVPRVDPAAVLLFAGDHGVVAEGVSAYPAEVTPQMILNFLHGGAAVNALARNGDATVRVIDVGVANPVPHPDLVVKRVRQGTENMAVGPAMSREEAVASLEVGMEAAREEIERGAKILALGEMGIGNTTPSSALLAAFGGYSPVEVCGPGTGLDHAGVQRKITAVTKALAVNKPDPSDPVGVLAKVGGLEIGALAGAMLQAAASRVPVVLDGFIVTAAALVAAGIAPEAAHYMVAAHRSAEHAHRLALDLLKVKPLVAMDLRLGEGSGATLVLPIVKAAARVMREMATFGEAGVSTASDA